MACRMGQLASAPQGTEAGGTAFRATLGRLLSLCGAASAAAEAERVGEAPQVGLVELDDGVTIGVAAFLDASSLGHLDAACRRLWALDGAWGGPWHRLGLRAYSGVELLADGAFDLLGGQPARLDWKRRYGMFLLRTAAFHALNGRSVHDITSFRVVLCNFSLRTEPLSTMPHFNDSGPTNSVCFEVEGLAHATVTLCVIDWEKGFQNMLHFHPSIGTVVWSKQVNGTLVNRRLVTTLNLLRGRAFEGSVGLVLREGRLAFFRRRAARVCQGEELEVGPWESTGFVTDLSWAEGRLLMPGLLFGKEGQHCVRMSCFHSDGSWPVMPKHGALLSDWTTIE